VVLQGDIYDEAFVEQLRVQYAPFDVILSDMAPSTSGIRVADSSRSALMFERTLELVQVLLRLQGHVLAKIFQGSEFHQILGEVKPRFSRVKVVKPDASRKESKEIYILAMGFKRPESIEVI
jgi:23S rRNA (uridine2552-2'-O)-methyltransferase